MKVSLNGLLRYITPKELALPEHWGQLHDMLEDIGLEVKRVEHGENDIVFTLELLANRGDHHCYMGLARELHLRTAWPLSLPDLAEIAPRGDAPLAVVQSEACLAYTLSEYHLEGEQQELPAEMRGLIELSGTNLIAPAVDITNFVNIEMGQPMHVFDADKVKGQVVVRDSKPSETALLLGASKEVTLPENTLVIADSEKVLAVAGVMGCETSKPTRESRRLYLESGTFAPVPVRKAARALGVQSLASARFERGADPSLAINAVARAHYLLQACGWNSKEVGVSASYNAPLGHISLSVLSLNHYFATDFTADALIEILKRMGSGSVEQQEDTLRVQIPARRMWDLATEADLFEEVARAVGYNQLPSVMPTTAAGARPSLEQRRLEEVEQLLIGEGYYEIFTDSFYSDQDVARLGPLSEGHPLLRHVRINNSESKAYSLLKNNNIVQALGVVETNARIKNTQVKVFERNKRFIPKASAQNGLCIEHEVIWGLALGEAAPTTWQKKGTLVDVYLLKGLVERLGARLGLDFCISPTHEPCHPYLDLLHPMRSAVIRVGGQSGPVVGVLGEIHPAVVKAYGLKSARPCFFEIDRAALTALPKIQPYKTVQMILPVKRDLCFGLYQQQSAGYIAELLYKSSEWLDRVEITDLFNIKDDIESVRAVTFSLYLDPLLAGKEVFSGAQINDEIERLAQKVVDHFGQSHVVRR